jgi:HD-like signal output (HDOD) protein
VRLEAAILARFRSSDYRPPMLPDVALEVVQISKAPHASFSRIAQLLEKDSMLAARVLRLAQSPAYARPGGVRSLREALVRLGLKTVGDLVWQAALDLRVFRSPRYQGLMEQIRRHSTATAYLARVASLFTAVPTEYAFLCGLIHDIGLAAAVIVLGERPFEGAPLEGEVLSQVLASIHEELSGLVARLWHLSPDLQAALSDHHRLDSAGTVHPLAAVICVAEHLAATVGSPVPLGAGVCDPIDRDQLRLALEALEISQAQLGLVKLEAAKVIGELDLT